MAYISKELNGRGELTGYTIHSLTLKQIRNLARGEPLAKQGILDLWFREVLHEEEKDPRGEGIA